MQPVKKATESRHGNVLVQHETMYDKKGNAVGTRYRGHGKRVMPIHHFYTHRRNGNMVCKVGSGDIWEVKQVPHPDYNFVTV